jgi:hypothetical protein
MKSEPYGTLSDALAGALATSSEHEEEVWIAQTEEGYFVCTYAAFPKGAEIVCIMSAATALTKFWNGQMAQRRKR